MTIQRLPGSAITPGTITVTQLDSATATVIQTGGGPKITNIQVTDAAYTVLDDTAVDTAGGNIRITGTGFVTGCSVIVGSQPASSVAFISSTEVRVQVGAQSAGTYIVYLVNPDGGVGIRVNGLTYSANPAWQTASALPEQYDNVAISLSLVATEATSYTITSGSLPPGLSLNANTGVITGTVTGITVDTLYTFTVRATDAQLQDSPRTFTVTITVSDPYFKLTTLLLSGSAVSANTVIRDSSTNNFNLTVLGDARASNFTPYGSGWSNLFNSNRLNIATTGFAPGTGNFTVEAWIYPTSYNSSSAVFTVTTTGGLWLGKNGSNWVLRAYAVADQLTTTLPTLNTWTHVAWVRNGSTATIYFNGNSVVSGTVTYNFVSGSLAIGDDGGGTSYFLGYISNLRYTTTAVYTANFTPATTNLTASAGTQLLTCQDNRFRDTSANAYTITTTGTPTVSSFNPFNITNTGVNGSIYLDGTGDYVTTPTSQAPLALDTANFTVECWVYFSSGQPQTNPCILSSSVGSSLANTILLQFGTQPSTQIALWVNNVHLTASATNNNLVFNAWNHIAVCRTGGSTYSFFINGIAVNSVASNSTSLTANDWRLGYWFSGAHALLGYITDFRIIKGTALYSSNFTPPTAPLTAVTNTQLLTFQFDQPHNNHTFLDSSSNQFLLTRYGNATQGTFSPFSQSGWSVLFNGSSGITLPNNANYGVAANTDFCWEAFIYMTSLPASNGHYAIWNNRNAPVSACGWQFGFANNSGTYAIVGTLTSGSTDTNVGINLVNQSLATANQWHHIALVRHSGVIYGYWNGVSQGTLSYTSSINAGAGVSGIGWRPNGYNDLYLSGYVSNFRFVNGSAVYPSGTTFTVPTTPLTAVTNTVLLTAASNRFRDLSTQNATVSVQSAPSVQAFAPFAATALYSAAVHGGSAYFDGSGDYLSTSWNSAPMGTEDFCIEFWVYPTAAPSAGGIWGRRISAGDNFQIYYGYPGNGIYLLLNDTTIQLGTATTPTPFAWTHYAYTREGTTLRNFINGVVVHTLTGVSTSLTKSYSDTKIGWADFAASWTGYISSFRVVRGSAVYNANFTLATTPSTASASTAFLLNFTDAAILDSTGRNAIETVADAKSSSVVTKFTGGSMYFDGTGDYLIMPDVLTGQFGTGDFTVEYWDRHGSQGTNYAPQVGTLSSGTGSGSWRFGTFSNLAGVYLAYHNGTSFIDVVFGSTVYNDNIWRHFALSRQGTTVRAFVDGVQVGSNQTVSQNFNSSNRVILGAELTSPTYFTGYIADLRITKGYARYTANFTAPTAPARLK